VLPNSRSLRYDREKAKLVLSDEMEVDEMVAVQCAKCGQRADLSLSRYSVGLESRNLEFRGVITCSGDGHQWPMAIKTGNIVQSTEQMMPILESASLSQNVPAGIVQDIQEAERAHFAQLYKASVVMCRRAIQLGLGAPPHSITDGAFSRMLTDARERASPPLSARGLVLAEGVKDYGDAGAHREEEISAEDARTAIFSAVKVLNELFPP
jgi:hypothetical protein